MNDKRTEYSKKIIELIQSVPTGCVATYGLIARRAGRPRGARHVGWLLHSCTHKYALPWQRIIKSDGSLSFPKDSLKFLQQKTLLEAEGIVIKNGRIDLKKYLWRREIFYDEAE